MYQKPKIKRPPQYYVAVVPLSGMWMIFLLLHWVGHNSIYWCEDYKLFPNFRARFPLICMRTVFCHVTYL